MLRMTRPSKEKRSRTGNRAMPELPWNIVLHNDWDNSMPRVVVILKKSKVHNNLHHVVDGVEAMRFLRRQEAYAGVPFYCPA